MSERDAIAARHAHVVGDGPRIAPLAQAELDEETIEIILAIRASARAGPLTEVAEYMRIVAKHPRLFGNQMEMGTTLFQGQIPGRERELAILRVGWLCQAPYEWGQHVAIARRFDVADEEIERVIEGADAPGWTAHDAAVIRGVDELLNDKALSDATWDRLALSWNEAQLIEYPTMVGQYVATAMVQNTLRIPLEKDNTGLTRR